ncbi:MAG: DEAD/DEAH box helicase [Candidatus Omnitrophota bacterium]
MKQGFVLDEFQRAAINHAESGSSVIVSAPTGAGKTLIAEHIIEECIRLNQGVIYTAPIKALSNQKFRDLSAKYPKQTGILTGDVSINPNGAVLIMTTEIFRNAILTEPRRFNDRTWIIFDEIHYLDDIERGTVWEETLILLPKHMRVLALSATLPNIDEFITWLRSVHNFPIKKVEEKTRPVPLYFRLQCNNTIFNEIRQLKNMEKLSQQQASSYSDKHQIKANKLFSLLDHLKKESLLPCIYFSFSRRRCENLANELFSFNFLTKEEQKRISDKFDYLVNLFNISGDPHIKFLYPLIERGIGYHHAGLLPTLKEIIERLFTTGLLKLIFTTETFALGINMPVKTVVFDTVYKYYGWSFHYLKTRDFYQMAGRAGRRNIDSRGFVYLRINPHHCEARNIEKIIYGRYEPITSQFRSSYATILNLYKIMGERLYDIYPLSFHFHQAKELQKKEALSLLKRKVSLLKYSRYINEQGISEKAYLASKIYSFELQMGELYQRGFFDSLDGTNLFILTTALVYEPRRGEKKPLISKKIKKMQKELKSFIITIHKAERKFRIYPLSKNFSFNIGEAARLWFEGADFYKLAKFCYADEGEIVRYFRMAIQILKEMRSCKVIDPLLKSNIDLCLRRVNRDIVDAEKQLRQVID